MSKPITIYALCDPDTNEVRYIGQATNPRLRLNGHLQESRIYNSRKCQWIRDLTAQGKRPTISTLAVVELSEANHVEVTAIKNAIEQGARLLNSHKHAAGSLANRS